MIGDCDAMGVSAEVAKHLLGSAEGRLAIYHPAQGEQLTDEALKEPGLRQALGAGHGTATVRKCEPAEDLR